MLSTLAVRPPNAFPESLKGRNEDCPPAEAVKRLFPTLGQQSFDFLSPPLGGPNPRIQLAPALNGFARKQAVLVATVRLSGGGSGRFAPVHPAAAVRHRPRQAGAPGTGPRSTAGRQVHG
jgi:hypothetical protein